MKILGIDPATNTGLALWDTENGDTENDVPTTRLLKVSDDVDKALTWLALRQMCGQDGPDFIIMERPFLMKGKTEDENKQSLRSYDTHMAIFHHFRHAIFEMWGLKFLLEPRGKITRNTRCRIVWPSTWQAVSLKGLVGTSKEKSKKKALATFINLPKGLSYDEYDAANMCYYQYLLCRDLGISGLSDVRQRVFEAMSASGYPIATMKEHDLLKGK